MTVPKGVKGVRDELRALKTRIRQLRSELKRDVRGPEYIGVYSYYEAKQLLDKFFKEVL